jgi:hypothetical protein
MKSARSNKVAVGLAAATLVALGIGVVGGQAAASIFSADENVQSRDSILAELPPIAVNGSGQTFGSLLHASSAADTPDLVLVVGDRGVEGYVYGAELNDPPPGSPEEALRDNGATSVVLTVYLSDGVTPVDTFTVGGATRLGDDGNN